MTRSYFNSQANIWDEKVAEKDRGKLERMAELLDIKPGSTILDVGTGTGVFIPFLLSRLGDSGKLVCLDFAEAMLQKARAKNIPGNIEYICADIEDSRLEDQSFDSVVCYSSFPHFRDKSRALKEIYRLLQNEGWLFICHTSSREHINDIHEHIPGLAADLIPGDNEMQSRLSSAGFQDIHILSDQQSYLVRAQKPATFSPA